MSRKLLLATNNAGKVREYRSLLQGIPFEMFTPEEMGIDMAVKEKGITLEENAQLKACALAKESGLLTLADDSGLEVEALHGDPGVKSARFVGECASDTECVNYLLSKLKDVPKEKRTARFRCVIGIARPDGHAEFCSGECNGIVTFEPRGENGFGYDPIFYLPKLRKTMAELPIDIKNRISHRGKAAEKARLLLKKMT